MGRRTRVPIEKPNARALVNAFLDYLSMVHGDFIKIAVKDWLYEKEKRLEGLKREQKKNS